MTLIGEAFVYPRKAGGGEDCAIYGLYRYVPL